MNDSNGLIRSFTGSLETAESPRVESYCTCDNLWVQSAEFVDHDISLPIPAPD